uniref:C-type lectin domain-containing protein n=1 Tax=Syphacia muris TaxID=451379 RepID=A0A0N5AR90_9BILA
MRLSSAERYCARFNANVLDVKNPAKEQFLFGNEFEFSTVFINLSTKDCQENLDAFGKGPFWVDGHFRKNFYRPYHGRMRRYFDYRIPLSQEFRRCSVITRAEWKVWSCNNLADVICTKYEIFGERHLMSVRHKPSFRWSMRSRHNYSPSEIFAPSTFLWHRQLTSPTQISSTAHRIALPSSLPPQFQIRTLSPPISTSQTYQYSVVIPKPSQHLSSSQLIFSTSSPRISVVNPRRPNFIFSSPSSNISYHTSPTFSFPPSTSSPLEFLFPASRNQVLLSTSPPYQFSSSTLSSYRFPLPTSLPRLPQPPLPRFPLPTSSPRFLQPTHTPFRILSNSNLRSTQLVYTTRRPPELPFPSPPSILFSSTPSPLRYVPPTLIPSQLPFFAPTPARYRRPTSDQAGLGSSSSVHSVNNDQVVNTIHFGGNSDHCDHPPCQVTVGSSHSSSSIVHSSSDGSDHGITFTNSRSSVSISHTTNSRQSI